MKYQMHDAVKRAQRKLSAFSSSQPVAVFAIACLHEWEDVAKAAARASLGVSLRKFDKKPTVKELKYLTGEQHQALLHYHWQCSVAATSAVVDFKSTKADSGWVWLTCQACLPHPSPQPVASRYGNDSRHLRQWFMDFIERTRGVLSDCPGGSVRNLAVLTPVLKLTHGCKNCREVAFEQILEFIGDFLEPRIQEELDKVRILT